MENLVWIVSVSLLTPTGLQQLESTKVFKDMSEANKFQNDINQNPIYKNINTFAFIEPAIFIDTE